MGLRFYNTMSRTVEPFEPIDPPGVRMYTCGPTVYDYAHIGNYRAYVFEDLLRRHLEFRGFDVTHIMNVTDVDDKTIRSSRERGIPLAEYTQVFKDAFFEDLKTLNILPAAAYPSATEHVPEMIALIERLFEKNLAYQSDDGSVYFRIAAYPEYGKLTHLDLAGLQPGARVVQDEYEKEHVGDFALWKAWTEADGDVGWESPWGRGRPGWHIECSAMAMTLLGESFDIHCGGVDNIFPHHEDEIAQSEGATGKRFARYWLHNDHLIVDRKKMAKSAGNFYTLRDILAKGYGGRELRYVLLVGSHYRQQLNFSFAALDAARASLDRLDGFRVRLRERAGGRPAGEAVPAWAAAAEDAFGAALDDDLNIAEAMAAVFDLVRAGNTALDDGSLTAVASAATDRVLDRIDRVLGFLQPAEADVDAELQELVKQREQARRDRKYDEADRIRDELAVRGWVVRDTPSGPQLRQV